MNLLGSTEFKVTAKATVTVAEPIEMEGKFADFAAPKLGSTIGHVSSCLEKEGKRRKEHLPVKLTDFDSEPQVSPAAMV